MVMGIPQGNPVISSFESRQRLMLLNADAHALIEDLAMGSRIDKDTRDTDSLMEIAAALAGIGQAALAQRLKFHAMRVNSLHLQLLKERSWPQKS